MKRRIILSLCFIFTSFMFLYNSNAEALGIGGYLTASSGSYDWTYEDSYSGSEYDESSSMSKFGMGFILDTTVAKDSLINYRLNVGYTLLVIDNDTIPDVYGYDFHIYNDLGFAIIRNDAVRIWIGPQLGLGFFEGTYDIDSANDETYDLDGVFITIGAVAGINIHLTDRISLCFDGGYRLSGLAGSSDIGVDGPDGSDFTGSGGEGFTNAAVIFRFNDRYESGNMITSL